MKIIGLMLVRSEDWIITASVRAAMRWCDGLAIVNHASTDETLEMIRMVACDWSVATCPIKWETVTDGSQWDEMTLRQKTLDLGRAMGGTHFAIVDADEIISANLVDKIRPEFEKLSPGQCLEVPMLAMRTLDVYQDDDSVWSRAWLTLGFADAPTLSWRPAEDGYQHHARAPRGNTGTRRYLKDKSEGGVFHVQFSNRRRLIAKHWLYAYVDHLRWPGREDVHQLSIKYSMALQKANHLGVVPEEWWAGHNKKSIKLDGVPWQEEELRRLLSIHGEKAFEGIKLSERRPV